MIILMVYYQTHKYTIIEEKSENGETSQSVLTLVNTDNPDESYLYNINWLSSGKLWL